MNAKEKMISVLSRLKDSLSPIIFLREALILIDSIDDENLEAIAVNFIYEVVDGL